MRTHKTEDATSNTFTEKLGGNSCIRLFFNEISKCEIDYTHEICQEEDLQRVRVKFCVISFLVARNIRGFA
jgi:hypothetical protein